MCAERSTTSFVARAIILPNEIKFGGMKGDEKTTTMTTAQQTFQEARVLFCARLANY